MLFFILTISLLRPKRRWSGYSTCRPAIGAIWFKGPNAHARYLDRDPSHNLELEPLREGIRRERGRIWARSYIIPARHIGIADPDPLLLYRSRGDISDDLFARLAQTLDIAHQLRRLGVKDRSQRLRVLLHDTGIIVSRIRQRPLPH